jgi:hypothetical protein
MNSNGCNKLCDTYSYMNKLERLYSTDAQEQKEERDNFRMGDTSESTRLLTKTTLTRSAGNIKIIHFRLFTYPSYQLSLDLTGYDHLYVKDIKQKLFLSYENDELWVNGKKRISKNKNSGRGNGRSLYFPHPNRMNFLLIKNKPRQLMKDNELFSRYSLSSGDEIFVSFKVLDIEPIFFSYDEFLFDLSPSSLQEGHGLISVDSFFSLSFGPNLCGHILNIESLVNKEESSSSRAVSTAKSATMTKWTDYSPTSNILLLQVDETLSLSLHRILYSIADETLERRKKQTEKEEYYVAQQLMKEEEEHRKRQQEALKEREICETVETLTGVGSQCDDNDVDDDIAKKVFPEMKQGNQHSPLISNNNGNDESYFDNDSWQRYTRSLPIDCQIKVIPSSVLSYPVTIQLIPYSPLSYNSYYAIFLRCGIPTPPLMNDLLEETSIELEAITLKETMSTGSEMPKKGLQKSDFSLPFPSSFHYYSDGIGWDKLILFKTEKYYK